MMKWGRFALATLGLFTGALLMVWWMNDRRIPTLRFSHTLGRGSEVGIDWIEIK